MKKEQAPVSDAAKAENLRQLNEAFRGGWRPKIPLPLPTTRDIAPALLCGAIAALREDRSLSRTVRLYLADALAGALDNPAKAAEALGINRPRGRGNLNTKRNYMKLAMGVHVLQQMGFALTPSNTDRGALARVAEAFHCSVDTVQRAWDENEDLLRLHDAFQAWESPIQ